MVVGGAAAEPRVHLGSVARGLDGFVVSGLDAGERAGVSVAGGGDVNGDGLADIVIGADGASPDGRTQAGRTYVVFGGPGGPADPRVARGERPGFVIDGAAAYDRSGGSVSIAGDVNGDGLDDIIVGAPIANNGGGRAYIVFGKAEETPVDLLEIENGGEAGLAIVGGEGLAGESVSSAGDVNGDGLADVLVGAPHTSAVEPFQGRAYVVFGKPDGGAVRLTDVMQEDTATPGDSGGFAMDGLNFSDECGFSVSPAGDHDGDGLDDILVTSLYGGVNDGEAFVVFGKPDGAPVDLERVKGDDGDLPGDSGGYVIGGAGIPGDFGYSAAGLGDVNGDGFPDVVVGAPPYHLFYPSYESGAAYVVFGKADGEPRSAAQVGLNDVELPGDSGGFAVFGANVHDFCGNSVAGAGDFNGDGLADVLVGSYRADPDDRVEAGQIHVVFGKPDGAPVLLSDLGYAEGLTIDGVAPLDWAGASVASAGDVNGDGGDDLVIGAPNAGDGGRVYVVFSSVLSRWVFVDAAFTGEELGTLTNPFNTIAEAVEAAPRGATIVCAPGSLNGPVAASRPLRIVNGDPDGGAVRIGGP